MNTAQRILVLALSLSSWAVADLPKKAPITKYTTLWTNSPFTSKPPVTEPVEVANPLSDYALGGISPVAGGYRVTLLNKKNPEERIIVCSDEVKPKHGFKIVDVKRKPGDPLGTTVRLSSGSSTGTVSFEEKLLSLTTAQVAKPNPQAQQGARPGPGLQPQVQPGQIAPRQPRPRVVQPNSTQTNPQANAPGAGRAPGQHSQTMPRADRRGGRR